MKTLHAFLQHIREVIPDDLLFSSRLYDEGGKEFAVLDCNDNEAVQKLVEEAEAYRLNYASAGRKIELWDNEIPEE